MCFCLCLVMNGFFLFPMCFFIKFILRHKVNFIFLRYAPEDWLLNSIAFVCNNFLRVISCCSVEIVPGRERNQLLYSLLLPHVQSRNCTAMHSHLHSKLREVQILFEKNSYCSVVSEDNNRNCSTPQEVSKFKEGEENG